MRGHADAETLAAFREELLSRRKAARVSAHLAACSRCAALDAQLAEVSALLTRSAAPPMPDTLTARIEAAIAAEAAARAATAADGAVAAGAPAAGARMPDGAARPRGHRAGRPARAHGGPGRSRLALRVAAVTAAVVVVAGGGYGAARLLAGYPALSTRADGAAAPAPGANGKAPKAAAGGLGASSNSAAASGTPAHPVVVSSGTDYQPDRLEAQVSAVLTQHGVRAPTVPAPAGQSSGTALRTPACVPHVTGGTRPLLVDLARYQGRPATVIVVPGGHGT